MNEVSEEDQAGLFFPDPPSSEVSITDVTSSSVTSTPNNNQEAENVGYPTLSDEIFGPENSSTQPFDGDLAQFSGTDQTLSSQDEVALQTSSPENGPSSDNISLTGGDQSTPGRPLGIDVNTESESESSSTDGPLISPEDESGANIIPPDSMSPSLGEDLTTIGLQMFETSMQGINQSLNSSFPSLEVLSTTTTTSSTEAFSPTENLIEGSNSNQSSLGMDTSSATQSNTDLSLDSSVQSTSDEVSMTPMSINGNQSQGSGLQTVETGDLKNSSMNFNLLNYIMKF